MSCSVNMGLNRSSQIRAGFFRWRQMPQLRHNLRLARVVLLGLTWKAPEQVPPDLDPVILSPAQEVYVLDCSDTPAHETEDVGTQGLNARLYMGNASLGHELQLFPARFAFTS